MNEHIPHIAMCSGGKDSVATILLAYINKQPLDEVVCAEVMFDSYTSGEYPEHAEFIHKTLKPWVENNLHIPFTIVHGIKTYKDVFLHTVTRGKNEGKTHGFLLRGMCDMNGEGKLSPIHKYCKNKYPNGCIEYVGIAVDESARLERMHKHKNKISLLEKYGYTEDDAVKLCKTYNLYSPSYSVSKRNGCWFCPNISDTALANIANNHPELIHKIIALELKATQNPANFAYPMFRYDKTIQQTLRDLYVKGLLNRRTVYLDMTGVDKQGRKEDADE